METNLALSLGSLLAACSMFYTMHKDGNKKSEQMADLKARVKHLESKSEQTDAMTGPCAGVRTSSSVQCTT